MTVAELIEKLKGLPQDLPVYVQHQQFPVKADEVDVGDFSVFENVIDYRIVPRRCVVISVGPALKAVQDTRNRTRVEAYCVWMTLA